MIRATPKLNGPFGIFPSMLLALVFGLIGSIPSALIVNYFYLDKPYAKPPVLLMLATFFPGLCFGIWYALNLRNRHCWTLTDTDLIGGIGKKTFSLASMVKIVVGLPNETFVRGLGKILEDDEPGSTTSTVLSTSSILIPQIGMVRQNYKTRKFQRERTLLVILADGALLPLFLFFSENGEVLMGELEGKLKDRLIFNYDFSPEQAHKLSMVEANVLIPANKAPRLVFNP
jgi:hypothetical protein